eukprot:2749170-Rhodomonas_salina.1
MRRGRVQAYQWILGMRGLRGREVPERDGGVGVPDVPERHLLARRERRDHGLHLQHRIHWPERPGVLGMRRGR